MYFKLRTISLRMGLFVVKNGKRGAEIEHKVMECLPGTDTVLSSDP